MADHGEDARSDLVSIVAARSESKAGQPAHRRTAIGRVARMKFVVIFLSTAASLGVAVWLVGGLEFSGVWWQFLIVAAIMGLANTFVRPVIAFFSIPFIIVTLGLFLLIVNALVLQLVVWLSGPSVLDLGLTSTGFFWATFWGSVVISMVGWIIGLALPDVD